MAKDDDEKVVPIRVDDETEFSPSGEPLSMAVQAALCTVGSIGEAAGFTRWQQVGILANAIGTILAHGCPEESQAKANLKPINNMILAAWGVNRPKTPVGPAA